jgi:predicted TIM-barrel fold metal-dependent hydrolase
MLKPEQLTVPAFTMPADACDCHMHVFGNRERYPLSDFRSYTVPDAPLETYRQLQKQVGLSRNVFVQASGYHTDNRCMLDALRQSSGISRGVAVVDPAIGLPELREMDALGVCGVRINLVSVGATTTREIEDSTRLLAKKLAEIGWHLQFFLTSAQVVEMQPLFSQLPVPVIIDHMGLPKAADGIDQAGFKALLSLLGDGHCWVKLAGADRVTHGQSDKSGAGAFVRALVDANSDQLVWGSDWPHIGWHSSDVHSSKEEILPYRPEDAGQLLSLLHGWIPDQTVFQKVLQDNPARFYGFDR